MTTIAKHDALLAEELRAIVEHYLEGPVPDALLRDLAGFTSGYTSRAIERSARPHPWPPKSRPRLDEGAAKRLERRRTA